MMTEEGSEYTVETAALWSLVDFPPNSIIEVPLLCTSLGVEKDISANFLVRDARLNTEAEICLEVKSLGCADANLCHWGDIYAWHVKKFKRWSYEAFSQELLSASMKAQLKKWINEEITLEDEDGPQEGEEAEEAGWEMPVDPRKPPDKDKSNEALEAKSGKELTERGKPTRPSAMKDKDRDRESRAGLRARLDAVKERVLTQPLLDRHPAGHAVRDRRREPINVEDSPSPGFSPSVERELLESGTELREAGETEAVRKRRKPPREDVVSIPHRRRKIPLVEAGVRQVIPGKSSSSKSCQMQLATRASEAALVRETRQKERKKKATKRQPAQQLVKALTRIAKGSRSRRSGSSKRKTKVKKEGKRKRSGQKKGDPGGGDDSPGSEGSYSDEEYYESEEESAKSSESGETHRGEPPLKRKSRKDPGSVLLMLVEHARNQLDQSARVSVPEEEMKTVTGGIRLSSYFQIIVRPQLGNSMAQAREMHLANAMDLLRQGQLTVLGDVLASRFMSLRQSVTGVGKQQDTWN